MTVLKTVQSYAPFYRVNNSTFSSRQMAFNAFGFMPEFRPMFDQEEEMLKRLRFQSLASFHNLTLSPATPTITTSDIARDRLSFVNTVEELDEGTYLIRASFPSDCPRKMEEDGHTEVLIKRDHFAIFYNNKYGALDITEAVGLYVLSNFEELHDLSQIEGWNEPEFCFYKVSCLAENILNLSTEMD